MSDSEKQEPENFATLLKFAAQEQSMVGYNFTNLTAWWNAKSDVEKQDPENIGTLIRLADSTLATYKPIWERWMMRNALQELAKP